MTKKVKCEICGYEFEVEEGKVGVCPICKESKYKELEEEVIPEPIPEPKKVDACPKCGLCDYEIISKPVDKDNNVICEICGEVYSFNNGEKDACPVCSTSKYKSIPSDKTTVRCNVCKEMYSF